MSFNKNPLALQHFKGFSPLANSSRRNMLKTLGAIAVVAPSMVTLGGCETLLEAIRTRPTRRDLATLAPNDPIIETYRAAVAAMKALPATDPRNWNQQAEIHFNFCPHSNWYFLPWHRAYLLYFEQICRELTGEKSFALPYWNWTCNRALPEPFLNNGTNPLFEPGRTGNPPAALPDDAVGPSVMEAILNEPNFLIFGSAPAVGQRDFAGYGPLEGTPHNFVHGFVGGVMGAFRSPRDPVFWMHHNMIERVWWEWNVVRGFANTNDPGWINFEFNANFVDRNGNSVDTGVLAMLLAPLLSYRFDDSPITSCGPVIGLTRGEMDRSTLKRLLKEGGPTSLRPLRTFVGEGVVDVPVGTAASQVLRARDPAVSADIPLGPDIRVLLRAVDVKQPLEEDFFVRVFINLSSASADTPTSDPHFAGSFAFFTDPDHAAESTFLVDATATLQRLRGLDRIRSGGEVSVQLIAVPMPEQRQPRQLRQTRLLLRAVELQLVQSRAAAPQSRGGASLKK